MISYCFIEIFTAGKAKNDIANIAKQAAIVFPILIEKNF
jgi:hypothetical protein